MGMGNCLTGRSRVVWDWGVGGITDDVAAGVESSGNDKSPEDTSGLLSFYELGSGLLLDLMAFYSIVENEKVAYDGEQECLLVANGAYDEAHDGGHYGAAYDGHNQ